MALCIVNNVGVYCFAGSPTATTCSNTLKKKNNMPPTTTSIPLPLPMRRRSCLDTTASSDVTDFNDDDDDDVEEGVPLRGGAYPPIPVWPTMDELDRKLIKITLPCIANFAINPLIGAVDLFWVSRMGNALAVAGQAAANQVFNSAFWIASFLPSGEFSVS